MKQKRLLLLLALLMTAATGAWAQEPETTYSVKMKAGTEDAKKWTITSGQNSVTGDAADGLTGLSEGQTVTLQYNGRLKVKGVKATSDAAPAVKPAATVTTAPTAKTGVKAGEDVAIVNAGAATGGTMMYKVTTANTKPTSTEGFSATVPTAEGLTAGTYYVWYYVKADDSHSDSEISATGIEVTIDAVPAATGHALSASEVGEIVCSDGLAYAAADKDNLPSGVTAVAIIAYVGTAGSVDASNASYKGLAIALSDANSGSNCNWREDFGNCLSSSQTGDIATALGFKNGIACTSTLTSDGHTHAAATAAANNNGTAAPTGTSGWFMPSMGQWNLIVQGLATKKAGSAVTTDLTYMTDNPTYKADNLNSVITDAGGTGFQKNSYWASTEQTLVRAWAMEFNNGYTIQYAKNTNRYVRSIIAF